MRKAICTIRISLIVLIFLYLLLASNILSSIFNGIYTEFFSIISDFMNEHNIMFYTSTLVMLCLWLLLGQFYVNNEIELIQHDLLDLEKKQDDFVDETESSMNCISNQVSSLYSDIQEFKTKTLDAKKSDEENLHLSLKNASLVLKTSISNLHSSNAKIYRIARKTYKFIHQDIQDLMGMYCSKNRYN